MRTIHLKCGHNIKVKTWPSSAGMAKVRHHYKKFHPARMKKMTKKSLATKAAIKWRKSLPKGFKMRKSTFDKIVRDVMATKRKRGLIKNRCNPKIKGGNLSRAIKELRRVYPYSKFVVKTDMITKDGKFLAWRKGNIIDMSLLPEIRNKPNPQPIIIYDKLLGIEARKSHGKFKGQNFKHDFKSKTDAMVLGNPDGSLTIKSKKGKRLWRNFNY